jgi:hypothetical protein
MTLAAFGTLLKLGDTDGGGGSYTTIAEVLDIDGPSMSADTIDTTHHSSASAARQHIISLIDAGEVSFEVNFLPQDATHDENSGLIYVFKNRKKRGFQLVFDPSGTPMTLTFVGSVTGFGPSAPVEGKLTASVTLKVDGMPTWT